MAPSRHSVSVVEENAGKAQWFRVQGRLKARSGRNHLAFIAFALALEFVYSRLCQPTTASGTLSVDAKYGLMSSSGVPSRQSSPTTDSVLPSIPRASPRSSRSGWAGPASARRRCRAGRRSDRALAAPDVTRRLVHPVQQHEVAAGLDVLQSGGERGSSSTVQTASLSRAFFGQSLRSARAYGCAR